MFNAPAEMQTRVFARLPDALRVRGRQSAWAFGKANPDLDSFLEGACFTPDGSLYVSDIPFGRVFRVSGDGAFALVAEYDGEPNGMALGRDGRLYIADHKRGLVAVDVHGGDVDFLLPRLRREGFKGLNDLAFDPAGNLYFNDQGQTGMQDPTGRIYRMNTDGTVDLIIDTVPSPNGMAFSPDGRTLYVAVTRANQIWRLPIHPDGSCTKAGIHLHMQGGSTGPDGVAMDRDGNLLVCQCGTDSAWLFSPWGEPLYRIRSCAGHDLTSAAYGGPDGRTLFITEAQSGQILATEMPVPGAELFPRV
jgi:gluconolactonase